MFNNFLSPTSTPVTSVPQNAGQNEENEKLYEFLLSFSVQQIFNNFYVYRAIKKLNVDASQPTTSIQIRLADGSRLSGQFNLSHSVQDIRTFIVKYVTFYFQLKAWIYFS